MLVGNHVMNAARPSDLKLNNRMQILELFKSGRVCSVAEIASEIGISRQTVMKAIQFFLEKGIIVSEGKAASGAMGGKRAELFSLSADRYLFNILISPDYLFISLFNFRCEVVDTFTRTGIADMDVDDIIAAAGAACGRLMLKHDILRDSVRGMCISTSGIVDMSTNRLRFNSLFPNWGKDIPIAEKLAACFDGDMMIVMENVSKVCGSAYLHQKDRANQRGATVFSGFGGVVACLMNRGFILRGKDSLIGEIGHMMLAPEDQEVCGCGGHGCFERQVSNERLRTVIADSIGRYPGSVLNEKPVHEITIRDVFEASAAGDALGRELSAFTARYFADALRNLTLVFNPNWVVFQGEYAWADDHFREVLFRELKAFRYYEDVAPFDLQMDRRPITDLTTIGAYTLLIDRLFSDQTTYS